MEKTEEQLPECPVCMVISWIFIPVRLILKMIRGGVTWKKTEKKLGCPMCGVFGWLFNLIKKPFEILCGKNETDSNKDSCSTSCSTKK